MVFLLSFLKRRERTRLFNASQKHSFRGINLDDLDALDGVAEQKAKNKRNSLTAGVPRPANVEQWKNMAGKKYRRSVEMQRQIRKGFVRNEAAKR